MSIIRDKQTSLGTLYERCDSNNKLIQKFGAIGFKRASESKRTYFIITDLNGSLVDAANIYLNKKIGHSKYRKRETAFSALKVFFSFLQLLHLNHPRELTNDISSIKVQEQLVQIERFLQKFCTKQKQLNEQIKQHSKLSISSVSSGSNVPRSQINLNISTLKQYIERRIDEIEKADILKINKTEKLRSEKKELDKYVDGLRQQIVDNFELKLYINKLETENRRLILQIEDRQRDIQKLEIENNKLRKEVSKQNNQKIVPFN
ncbi:hypothetical protein GT022_16440 [Agaribacter marinus]|uniref:Uncharacterized protein n=1 Tax=Virgibacillus salarius TaxID=447199 RepID=A0A941IDZ9_9BACI|nr:hypothetical protein [Virgibacillus salarius]MBR7797625.1 hypothetical protein [Virgibacillus salarius]NAZ10334.1 hypothetical protein [Agaribacter marinus]